ncbi:MAG: peroxiredoxin family protein [Anaerolineales bacterium]|nr:peroxiredoxin family protein [Anaerolineales bacterium]MCZ2123428.1 peroxiredoxin family protein [Anaerolineales bacterium]
MNIESASIEAKIGSLAPNFSLTATNGQEITLADFRGKSNVIVFFVRETSCIQCRIHVAHLGKLYQQFQAAGTEIIVILGEGVEKSRKFAESLKLPFPILADPDRRVYLLYELEKYFSLFQRTASLVVDQSGIVRYLKRTTIPNVWLQESRELYGFVLSLEN